LHFHFGPTGEINETKKGHGTRGIAAECVRISLWTRPYLILRKIKHQKKNRGGKKVSGLIQIDVAGKARETTRGVRK